MIAVFPLINTLWVQCKTPPGGVYFNPQNSKCCSDMAYTSLQVQMIRASRSEASGSCKDLQEASSTLKLLRLLRKTASILLWRSSKLIRKRCSNGPKISSKSLGAIFMDVYILCVSVKFIMLWKPPSSENLEPRKWFSGSACFCYDHRMMTIQAKTGCK